MRSMNDEITVIYSEKKEITNINIIDNFMKKQGVWALYGKKNDKYICLNVGKSMDVGSEILYDLGCMHYLMKKDGDIPYINQFADESEFKWKAGMTQEYLYPYIYSDGYDELAFVYVHDKSDGNFEKSFAWATHAKYWRNGKSFDKSREGYYAKMIKNNCGSFSCVDSLDNLADISKIIK